MTVDLGRYVTPKTALYAIIGDISKDTSEIVFALHGYGQLASEFAESLAWLATNERVLVCPEAISRFYTNHLKGKVGASWMTSQEREYEIVDYVTYLDGLASSLMEEAPDSVRVTVLGFSQGGASASRWIGNGVTQTNRLIFCGSDPAHDLSEEEWDVLADIPDIILSTGSEDQYISEARLIEAEEVLRDHQCTFETIRFDGGHEIIESVLKPLFG